MPQECCHPPFCITCCPIPTASGSTSSKALWLYRQTTLCAIAMVWWSAGVSPRSSRKNVAPGDPSGRTQMSLGMSPKCCVYQALVAW